MARSVANRATIEPFLVMEVVAAAQAQELRTGDVLHLEVGQPGTGAPESAIAAAISYLESGDPLGYTPACGIDPLRRRVAQLYRERYDIDVDAARVIITAGASGAIALSLLASFDVGDRVVVSEPGYPCYRQMISAFGLEPVPIRVGAATRFLLTPELLDDVAEADANAGRRPIDGVIIASPANPTGSMYDPSSLAALAHWCDRNDVRLVADEIYHGITFDRPAPTALAHDIGEIVIGSFSKYYCMTGWRLGWMVVPDELIVAIDRLSQNLYLSPPALAQHVALAALDCTEALDTQVERYRVNRSILLEGLTELGLAEFAPSDGAFYLYSAIDPWSADSTALCSEWLAEIGLAATPGIDFDPVDGHRWVRWSLAGSTADITEAAHRLRSWANRRADAPLPDTETRSSHA